MKEETLVLVIQELKVLKGKLIVNDVITANEAGFIQLAISYMAAAFAEEVDKVEKVEPINDNLMELCSFLLMKANKDHVEVVKQALDYRYANLVSEVLLHSGDDGNISQQQLEHLEDIRSLLPPIVEIETPSSADLISQIRGGKKDE